MLDTQVIETNTIDTERGFTSGVYPKRDVAIVRGSGARLWDDQGNQYIDCVAGQGAANLGHSHPDIVAAVTKQLETLISCPEIFYNDRRSQLLSKLAKLFPFSLTRFFLCNSGTEAVEAALKFSRLSTGRTEVVAAMRGFHGRTYGALSATWEREYRKPFEPLVPNFLHIPFNNIEAAQTAISEKTAAIIVEIVQGEGGVRPGSGEYFQTLQQLCSKTGTLLILDEVQTGFGRTGKMFAYEHYDLKPDIVCLGKSIAGGLAMGAVALGERVATLPPKAHGSTFGGNPVASAAAIATIEVFERDQLAERARQQGDFLLESLRKIDSPLIREVRGLGLLVGIELKLRVTPLLQKLMKRGILALPAGSTVLRLLPPLVISRSDLEQVVVNIEESLAELEKETNR